MSSRRATGHAASAAPHGDTAAAAEEDESPPARAPGNPGHVVRVAASQLLALTAALAPSPALASLAAGAAPEAAAGTPSLPLLLQPSLQPPPPLLAQPLPPAAPSAPGLALKVTAFVSLVAIQVTTVLVYKAAQDSEGRYYFDPAAVMFFAELLKLLLSLALFAQENWATASAALVAAAGAGGAVAVAAPALPVAVAAAVREAFLEQGGLSARSSEASRMVPWVCAGLAAAYCINNQFTFVLLQWADGANFNLIKGCSSVVSTLMLHFGLSRRFSSPQWSAVWLQVCGLVVAQFAATCTNTPVLEAATYLLLFISVCITSLSSVVNDKVLKDQKASLHVINAVLYFFGVVFNGTVLVFAGGGAARLFSGFDRFSTYPVLMCNALIGIAVTAVYKYTDATMKTFASACVTSVLMLINVLFNGVPLKVAVVMGCVTVFLATHLYATNGIAPAPPPATAPSPPLSAVAPTAKGDGGSPRGEAHVDGAGAQWVTERLPLVGR